MQADNKKLRNYKPGPNLMLFVLLVKSQIPNMPVSCKILRKSLSKSLLFFEVMQVIRYSFRIENASVWGPCGLVTLVQKRVCEITWLSEWRVLTSRPAGIRSSLCYNLHKSAGMHALHCETFRSRHNRNFNFFSILTPYSSHSDPPEAILVIFGRRALIFLFLFLKALGKIWKLWHHFCVHAQWRSPWRRKNVEKGHLAPSNLTFLLTAIDRNGFRRMKEEAQIYKMLQQIFLIFA